MDYQREISSRDRQIAEHKAKIAELQAELDKLWRDEGIACVDHEVPLDWRDKPQPMRCRKCRKKPVLTTKKQRQVDAVVDGRLTKVWQDYYVYSTTRDKGVDEAWCQTCRDECLRERDELNRWLQGISRDNYC